MAHRARLVLGGLIMGRSRGTLDRERVALQAQQIHLAHAQETRIGRPMRHVTTATSFRLHRYMLKNERPLLVGVALDTNCVPTRHGPHLAEGGSAVDVVAVAALDEAFVYAMVIRLREVGLRVDVTSVAEFGLRRNQEVLRLFCVVGRVAVQAPNIVARVRRRGKVSLLMILTVATQAAGVGVLLRH